MNTGIDYHNFYEILLNLRELYHSYGRIDDSNSKLDEITKLFMVSYYHATRGERFSLSLVRKYSFETYGNENRIALALREIFKNTVTDQMFNNCDGTCIFGSNPDLNIQPSENEFAEKIINEIEKIDFINIVKTKNHSDMDIINECFGHFIRDNFRNNKEDAQYMTPAEIIVPLLNVIFKQMEVDGYFNNTNSFKIMDPTCGVGTLLVETARKYIAYVNQSGLDEGEKRTIIDSFLDGGIIGQDKVDRMVRLSKMNSLLFGSNISNIYVGNSIVGDSVIDSYRGSVDLIVTNPPFGAEYDINELDDEKYPFIEEVMLSTKTFDSELLMLLRCIDLLKDNGYLAIVLPDSVFSSKGMCAQLRSILLDECTVISVFQLPAVTFAQAGTRTKTAILLLRKTRPPEHQIIRMCICENVGYDVKEKSGVPVKIERGTNDLLSISKTYIDNIADESTIICVHPSITNIVRDDLIDDIINPSFYDAKRIKAVKEYDENVKDGFKLCELGELVSFETKKRKSFTVSDNIKHISVLHIGKDSIIDFKEVESYLPSSKGRLCEEGDLIFSKINPQIPRMAVVPISGYKLVCSNEFEIMRPKEGIDVNVLCMLLKTKQFSIQVESLTSGTSSSHSRVKSEQLAKIVIPYPTKESTRNQFLDLGKKIADAFYKKYQAEEQLNDIIKTLERVW